MLTGYTLTYTAPPSAQPEILFRLGSRIVKIADGETLQMAAQPEEVRILPPGVTAELTAKPEPPPKPKPPRSTLIRPASKKADETDEAAKAEETT